MGNDISTESSHGDKHSNNNGYTDILTSASKTLSGACGSLSDALESPRNDRRDRRDRDDTNLLSENLCGTDYDSPEYRSNRSTSFRDPEGDDDESIITTNPMSALFARALVSEVTDNPRTMLPAAMAEREKRLLKAQERAKTASKTGARAVGAPGGIGGPGGVLGAMSNFALDLDSNAGSHASSQHSRSILPPNPLSENRAQVRSGGDGVPSGKHRITIGLSLSRRHSTLGHPDTVTRQTAFDFNELQDRQYKYVSSTDSSGWRAGGGERGGGGTVSNPSSATTPNSNTNTSSANTNHSNNSPTASFSRSHSEDGETNEKSFFDDSGQPSSSLNAAANGLPSPVSQAHKVAAPDTVHIPVIHIDCDSPAAVDSVIAALARGEVFIPHMSVLPEALGVNGISPPDLVVRFGCERNDDIPPEEWPNWCLEFMHNQLYEYFAPMGARWMKRPFQITLARKVRWKTVKHMNKFFAHSERVINAWREKGPQYLDPQLSYIEGGATPEEVARPHGIYLLRNGRPTNYFPPNFEPPYTTKMTRSLLLNVIGKSWDKKMRDWTSEPVPRVVTPGMLFSTMCGCADTSDSGFIASEATNQLTPMNANGMEFFGSSNAPENHNPTDNSFHIDKLQQKQLKNSSKHLSREDSMRSNEHSDHEKHRRSRNRGSPGGGQSPSSSLPSPEKMSRTHSSSSRGGSGTRSSQRSSTSSRSQTQSYNRNQAEEQGSRNRKKDNPTPERRRQVRAPRSEDPTNSPIPMGNQHGNHNNDYVSSPEPKSQSNSSNSIHTPEKENQNIDFPNFSIPGENPSSPPPANSNPKTKSPDPFDELDRDAFNFSSPNLNNNVSTKKDNFDTPVAKNGNKIDTISGNQTSKNEAEAGGNNANGSAVSISNFEEDMAVSVAQSEGTGSSVGHDMAISIGESQTTVPIINGSSSKFIEQERERRKQREIEREKERKKMDELELAIQEKMKGNKEKEKEVKKEKGSKLGNILKSSSKKKDKKEKKKDKKKKKDKNKDKHQKTPDVSDRSGDESARDEKAAQSRIESAPKEKKSDVPFTPVENKIGSANNIASNQDSSYLPLNLSANTPGPSNGNDNSVFKMSSSPKTSYSPEITSQVSLDYSVDTASLLGDGSLVGGQFAGDGSVITLGTAASENKSLLSCVTRTTVHDASEEGKAKNNAPPQATNADDDDDDDISLSLLESTSSVDQIPTDEELFAVGWAKALDPSSGSYYYFTLDRTKIVWDNPLAGGETPTA